MIEVCFLGVGAALPAPGATNCSYLVRAGGAAVLVDCGPAVLQQLAAVGLTPGDVTHLFVTHRHGDHALGFPLFVLWWALDPACRGRARPPVLASRTTWTSLLALWEHSYGELPAEPFPWVELPPSEAGFTCPLEGWPVTVKTWPMDHSSFAPVLGCRLEHAGQAVAFTGDTRRCDAAVELARGVDLLVHDANFSATVDPKHPEDAPGHGTASVAGKTAAAAGARRLALVHIGPEYAGRHNDLVREARACFDGPVFAPAGGEKLVLP